MAITARRNLILTGFMGTGKSTVAARLVDELGYDGIDTDSVIAGRHGAIPVLFAARGEAAFRAIEEDLCQELAAGEGQVISTGGGTLLKPVNAKRLGTSGEIYCLTASPETILERVTSDGLAQRPLLTEGDPLVRITELLARRAERYATFAQVTTDERTPAEIAAEILDRFSPD